MHYELNMKNLTKFLCLALAVIALNSCDKKKDTPQPEKPKVVLTEVGHGNNQKAHPGHDLHLEATIDAPALVKRIEVEIHQTGGGTYEIEQTYTSGAFIGVRNATFHKHIDIPADAPLGHYHLHFTVIDQAGQKTVAESGLTLVEGDDDHDHAEEGHHDHDHQ